jgi:Glycosyl hydrolases family 31/Galactose mutarotase-like
VLGPATLVILLVALVAPAAAAQAAQVDAGSLRARTTDDPWSLIFIDRDGRTVLAEAPGTGSGPTGTLGFRTAAGWSHATRVVEGRRVGRAYEATLATTDPAGRRLALRLQRDHEGVIALTATVTGPSTADVTHTGIAFRAREGERYLGFGERSNAVDQRGRQVESYVAEGPFEEDERAFIPAFVPPWGYHPRDDATYFPMPWLLSTAGYGVLVDSPETSLHRLDSPGAWSVEVETRQLRMFGPDLLAAPVLDEGARRREVYLPRGRWVDLWRSARYRAVDGGLSLGRARLLGGGRRVRLPAPLAELPLLARAGALIPLLPPDVDTLARYGDRAPVVSLRERRGERVLLAFPRGRSSARLEDGGTLRSREGRDGWRLDLRSRRTRRWTIEASLATLRRPFRPCAAEAQGGRLRRWRYDRRARVLRATFTTRRGSLTARPCGR